MTVARNDEFGIIVVAGQRFARWYDDGPSPRRFDGSDQVDVERAFRRGFMEAAREVAAWSEPDDDACEAAWAARRSTYAAALVRVPSADYFAIAESDRGTYPDSDQIVYRLGHAVAAAEARGRDQATAMTRDAWLRFRKHGASDDSIKQLLPIWLAEAEEWASSDIDPARSTCPPFLGDYVPPEEAEPSLPEAVPTPLPYVSARQLMAACPALRPPVIESLLREGETMNVIASPKTGKSWLVLDLAIAVATGRPWLGRFATVAGDVLIIDNELHGETSANRIPRVAKARGIGTDEFADSVFIRNLRGGLQDIVTLGTFFRAIEPGRFRLIVLDAFYRFLPAGTDENANADMASLYNHIDRYAADLGCAFVLIHHSSKGNQSGKSVTDVGAGAGSQSRATDAHLVLRPHEESDVVVLEAAVRSWPPLDPVCLRWAFPVWDMADDLDAKRLKVESSRRRQRSERPPPPEDWTPERFVGAFVSGGPALRDEILLAATKDLSHAQATRLLKLAEARGLVQRSQPGPSERVRFVVARQPETGP